jgi:plastocyanin
MQLNSLLIPGIIAILILGAITLTFVAPEETGPRIIEVDMHNNFFSPSLIEVEEGELIEFHVKNVAGTHTFTLDGHFDVRPGSNTVIETWTVPTISGDMEELTFRCVFHSGMTGTIRIFSVPEPPRLIEISMLDNSFNPSLIEVEVGETVTFNVTNQGSFSHTFTIDGHFDVTINSGNFHVLNWTVPPIDTETDELVFYCAFHSGMEGVIKITDPDWTDDNGDNGNGDDDNGDNGNGDDDNGDNGNGDDDNGDNGNGNGENDNGDENGHDHSDSRIIDIIIDDDIFSPNLIRVIVGENITFSVSNNGLSPHTFTLDDHFNLELDSMTSGIVNWIVPDFGGTAGDIEDFEFYCAYHVGMIGTLRLSYEDLGVEDDTHDDTHDHENGNQEDNQTPLPITGFPMLISILTLTILLITKRKLLKN